MRFNRHTAIIGLIIANIIWGATSPIVKWSLTDMSPFVLAFFRFALATIILFPFAYKYLSIKPADIWKMILLTFFGMTLSIGLFFMGLTYTESINAPLIGSAGPIFVIFICIFFFGEKARLRSIIGGIIGLIGILAILLEPILTGGLGGSIFGNILLVGATLCGIVHLFISQKLSLKYAPITITFYSFWLGLVSFTPFFAHELVVNGFPAISMQSFIGIVYTAVFASALAHYLFYGAASYVKPSEISLFSYMTPIVAVLVAMPLLGEKITPMYLIGALLVFAGIYLAEAHTKAHLHHHPK